MSIKNAAIVQSCKLAFMTLKNVKKGNHEETIENHWGTILKPIIYKNNNNNGIS